MRNRILFIFLLSITLISCSNFEKLLKSSDNQLKLEEAKKYYDNKKWLKAITLLDAVAPYYKGTSQSEEVLYLTAQCYYGNKDYYEAASYYTTYTKTFARGKYAEDAWFMIGYCHYQQSPDARLDQTETIDAVSAFEEYQQIFPNGKRIDETNKYLNELNEKLAYKAFLSAKLYFDLGNYLGNNYLSAIITAKNILRDYPNTAHKEELSFLILKSKFKQAELSIPSKKADRYRETIDEYYNFNNDFPNSQFSKEAKDIFDASNKFVKE